MANEAEIIENPTSTPTAVSTGYQAQNTNLIVQRLGVDKSSITVVGVSVTLQISGPIDVNGVMYSIKSAVAFNLSTAGRYFISLNGAGPATLTPTLSTDSGTFDALKNARYNGSGYRVLNWCLDSDGVNVEASVLITPYAEVNGEAINSIPNLDAQPETYITVAGTWTAPRSKFYNIWVTARGGDGGAGGTALPSDTGSGGGGGGGGLTGFKRIYISAGDTWTSTFSASNGGNTSFSDGVTSLIAQNGFAGGAGTSNDAGGAGGGGNRGITSTGFDKIFESNIGSGGGGGSVVGTFGQRIGGTGGMGGDGGGGGIGGAAFGVTTGAPGNSSTKHGGGGGGGGGGIVGTAGGAGGTGGSGLIRIVG